MLEVSDFYFETVSSELRNEFTQSLWEAQTLLVATGAPSIRLDEPLFWSSSRFISVFQNVGPYRTGYFCPQGLYPILQIDYANASTRVPEKLHQLEENYGFSGFSDSEIHQSLRSYVKIISKAVQDEAPARVSEVFLQNVIAIDLLLGEEGLSSDSFSRRAAAIYATTVGAEYETAYRSIKQLYDKRSRYVHQGEAPQLSDLELVVQVASTITECLLRLQANEANHSPGFIRGWLSVLDAVAASMKAKRQVSAVDLTDAGLPTVPDTSTPALERLRLAVTGNLLGES